MSQIEGERRAGAAPKRVLLAWEFGAGRTHVANLLGVAAHLRRAGVECIAALYDMGFAPEFAALGIPAVQNYVWPARRRAPFGWQERDIRALGDVLANLGFADPPSFGAALAHYDGLFSLTRPDVVLCENAFGAVLAARGQHKVVAFGTASCLPPIEGRGFAVQVGSDGPPSWPEGFVRTEINKGLLAAGRDGLAALADLLDIDGVYPFGPQEFDIYGDRRAAPMLPPHLPGLERPVRISDGEEIFVYLHGFVQGILDVMQGLRSIDRPMRLFIPGLAAEAKARFPASCRFETQAVPLPDILRRSRCVLHHGGPQMTSICLAAGLPQVILAKELDNELCARLVRARGLGAVRHISQVRAPWLASVGQRAYDDREVKQRCAAAAPEFAAWLAGDPARTVADAVLALIGSSGVISAAR